jgi:hypothetical protein
LTEKCIQGVFWAEFFFAKKSTFDSGNGLLGQNKVKNNKAIFFCCVKIKSFVPNFW